MHVCTEMYTCVMYRDVQKCTHRMYITHRATRHIGNLERALSLAVCLPLSLPVAVALCYTAMYMCEILYVERYTYRDVHVYEVNALKRYPCGCGECTYVAQLASLSPTHSLSPSHSLFIKATRDRMRSVLRDIHVHVVNTLKRRMYVVGLFQQSRSFALSLSELPEIRCAALAHVVNTLKRCTNMVCLFY